MESGAFNFAGPAKSPQSEFFCFVVGISFFQFKKLKYSVQYYFVVILCLYCFLNI